MGPRSMVHEVGTKELILKGFKETGFVDFNGSIDHLHSRLQEVDEYKGNCVNGYG